MDVGVAVGVTSLMMLTIASLAWALVSRSDAIPLKIDERASSMLAVEFKDRVVGTFAVTTVAKGFETAAKRNALIEKIERPPSFNEGKDESKRSATWNQTKTKFELV
jgi:hypothetical protein